MPQIIMDNIVIIFQLQLINLSNYRITLPILNSKIYLFTITKLSYYSRVPNKRAQEVHFAQ